MLEETEKWLNEQTYRSAHDLAKLNPSALADMSAKTAIKSDAYQKALEDILKASTVGEMVKIADRVLKENKK